jgi:hypothetical protein
MASADASRVGLGPFSLRLGRLTSYSGWRNHLEGASAAKTPVNTTY